MINPLHIRDDDKHFLVGSIALPLLVWGWFVYRKRYSTKGMK